MQSVAQLEASIQMQEGFESPELEAEMVKALEGPQHEVNASFFMKLRQGWKDGTGA